MTLVVKEENYKANFEGSLTVPCLLFLSSSPFDLNSQHEGVGVEEWYFFLIIKLNISFDSQIILKNTHDFANLSLSLMILYFQRNETNTNFFNGQKT